MSLKLSILIICLSTTATLIAAKATVELKAANPVLDRQTIDDYGQDAEEFESSRPNRVEINGSNVKRLIIQDSGPQPDKRINGSNQETVYVGRNGRIYISMAGSNVGCIIDSRDSTDEIKAVASNINNRC